jgi:hypothetical protein
MSGPPMKATGDAVSVVMCNASGNRPEKLYKSPISRRIALKHLAKMRDDDAPIITILARNGRVFARAQRKCNPGKDKGLQEQM